MTTISSRPPALVGRWRPRQEGRGGSVLKHDTKRNTINGAVCTALERKFSIPQLGSHLQSTRVGNFGGWGFVWGEDA